MCAHAVRVAIRSVSGVDSARVSLEQGLATVWLRPDNHVRIAQIRDAIRSNGFSPKDGEVTVRGRLSGSEGAPIIVVEGSDEVLLLGDDPGAAGKLADLVRLAAGTVVTIRGRVPEVKARRPLNRLRLLVRSFER